MTRIRSFIYFVFFLGILAALWSVTNAAFPDLGKEVEILFASGLLLIILGVFITERYFTRPLDVIVNVITVTIVLWTLDVNKTFVLYQPLIGYLAITAALATLSFLIFSETKDPNLWHQRFARSLNHVSTFLGSSKLLFSILFILSLFNYLVFSLRNSQQITEQQFAILGLIVFWVSVILVEPIDRDVIQPLIGLVSRKERKRLVGQIVRRQAPNILFVEQSPQSPKMSFGDIVTIDRYRDSTRDRVPNKLAMFIDEGESEDKRYLQFYLLETLELNVREELFLFLPSEEEKKLLEDQLAASKMYQDRGNIIGTVAAHSDIDVIKIKMITGADALKKLEEGDLVSTDLYGAPTKYQILNVQTEAENIEGQSKKGTKIITAQQIGAWTTMGQRFENKNWVPDLNSLVFLERESETIPPVGTGFFRVGVVPKSHYPIYINFTECISHHLAIIGKTGTGKSRMAAKIIEQMASEGYKVVVFEVDRSNKQSLTNYIDDSLVEEKAEKEFNLDNVSKNVVSVVWDMESKDRQGGALNLSEAAAAIIDKIISYQFKHPEQQICIVMEEAYDFIPESTFGRQDFGQPKVSRISQQVLKCRKHNIGFIVITQRTALVTKTILYQCHTIIAQQSFDETAKTFMGAYIDSKYLESMSILPRFRAIVVGKGSTCDKPVIVNFEDKAISKK